MVQFKPVTIDDKKWIDAIVMASGTRGCQYNFTNIFAWSEIFKYRIARVDGYLLVKGEYPDGVPYYFYPAGSGDAKAVIKALAQESSESGHQLKLGGLSPENLSELENLFPGDFEYDVVRDMFDYVYLLSKLVNLSGSKLRSKRNHVNHFQKNNEWSFETISPANIDECWEMNVEWCEIHGCDHDSGLDSESCAIRRCFKYFAELGLEGGLLRADGKVIAYTIGSQLNADTYDIHFEKAFETISGAYQMINRQFAAYIQQKHPNIIYVNREEDMGQEGLRKSKLSYRPDLMVEKSWARLVGTTVL